MVLRPSVDGGRLFSGFHLAAHVGELDGCASHEGSGLRDPRLPFDVLVDNRWRELQLDPLSASLQLELRQEYLPGTYQAMQHVICAPSYCNPPPSS